MRGSFLVIGVLTASLFLAACGGGGGGGGSSRPALTPEEQAAKIDAVFTLRSQTVAQVASQDAVNSGYSISKTRDGIRLQSSKYVDDRVVSFSALSDDFVEHEGFLKSMKTTKGTATGGWTGSYEATDAVWLGGKTSKLEHSDFGSWRASVKYSLVGSDLKSGGTYVPFFMGDPNKKAHFATPEGMVSFSGVTMSATSFSESITGTVNLNIDTAALGSSQAVIRLPEFYDFTVPIAVGASGDISKRAGSIGYTRNGSKPRPSYETVQSVSGGSLSGQFYGKAPGKPTEAAGIYEINLIVKDSAGKNMPASVSGSFGAKR